MTEESDATNDQVPEWVIPEDGICDEYSDWTHVNWLPLKVRIRFAQIKADPRKSPLDAAWVVEERTAITMPWQAAKTLGEVLTKIVAAYEKTNGPIVVPEQAILD